MELKKILVAVNGNGADEEAIKLACSVARRSKAAVYVVYIIQVKRSLPLNAEISSEIQRAEEVLTHAEDIASEQDCDVETDLLQAREVGPAIVDEAMERDIDLIVLGMPYKRAFGMFSLGTTVPYVLREAPCRVLLCREPIS